MKTDTNSLILKSGRDRSVNNFHPWIFSGAVKVLPEAANGDIISVRDNHGKMLGYGFFSPKSQIVCRIFEFSDNKIDFTAPDFWTQKVEDAFRLRRQIIHFENTDTYRLLHAEGDFLPGIIADVYGDVLVLQLLIKGTEKVLPQLLTAFEKVGFVKIYLKNKENPHRFEEVSLKNGFLRGEAAGNIAVKENGLLFDVNFATGQKTGFFIDQRENRETVKKFSTGKRVLNAFSYTGGFSVYALAGGAKLVHSVDISKDASEAAKRNVVLNFGENAPHESIAADCFDYLRTMSESAYDIIVLDPPAFAKNAGSVPNASRGYKDLNMTAMQKAAPDSLLFTFSCSQNIDKELFRKIIFSAAADAKRKVRILQMFSQSGDHPVNIFHPESEYLKGLLLHIE